MVKKVQRPARGHGTKKYLIRWKIKLGQDELLKIAQRPEVLERALSHVNKGMKEREGEIYRIVPLAELTNSARMWEASASPEGIAIMESSSLEHARKVVEEILEGLTFGGFPIARGFLEFQINPLAEVGEGGRR